MFVCAVMMLAGPSAAAASDSVAINDLIENSIGYDGQDVSMQGEAIGEVLERGGYAWVNVSDGGNAIGLWMTLEDADKIEYFGDYKNSGDVIHVTGVFSRNCPQHGGDIDIHCAKVEIITSGHPVSETIHSAKITAAIILAVVSAAAIVYFFTRRNKQQQNEENDGNEH